ncbi:MAG: rare lipoprotein [Verrucomicrobiota bacterium]|jgi:rare lipoprotein A
MPTPRRNDLIQRIDPIVGRFLLKFFRPVLAVFVLATALTGTSCKRPSTEVQAEKPKPPTETEPASAPTKEKRKQPYHREGLAVWYPVPADSLAKRRAGKDELTAAHNHLPLGTVLRVTHLANGKSVIVRITDRGITKRGASIDLCKEAAEQLDMISEGMARVRMEEIPDDRDIAAVPDSSAPAAQP